MEPLKNWYNEAFYQQLTDDINHVYRRLDREGFYRRVTADLDEFELMERLRRTSIACREYLPQDYRRAVAILRKVVPRIQSGFYSMFMPDFVGLYGLDDFDFSMDALKYFTPFSSSEFGVREFFRRDPERTLAFMQEWSRDSDHHVRRLASEGSRPRLPWSFRLDAVIAKPSIVRPILEELKADPHIYVRKSVANHLNDISKDHPELMLDWVTSWDQSDERSAWISKRAARSLIKAGNPRAFALFGFEALPRVEVEDLRVASPRLSLGSDQNFSFRLRSRKRSPQRLVVDYRVYYIKKSGQAQPKVFKLKEIELAPGTTMAISKKHVFRDMTTRRHYAGTHGIEIMVNGRAEGRIDFELTC